MFRGVSEVQHTVVGELKEIGHVLGCAIGVARVGQLDVGIPELVEEWVNHSLDSGQTLSRCVLEQFGDEVNCIGVSFAEHLNHVMSVPWSRDFFEDGKISPC